MEKFEVGDRVTIQVINDTERVATLRKELEVLDEDDYYLKGSRFVYGEVARKEAPEVYESQEELFEGEDIATSPLLMQPGEVGTIKALHPKGKPSARVSFDVEPDFDALFSNEELVPLPMS